MGNEETVKSLNKSSPRSRFRNRVRLQIGPIDATTHAAQQCKQFAITPAPTNGFRNLVFNGAEYSVPVNRDAALRPSALSIVEGPAPSPVEGADLPAISAIGYPRRSYRGTALRFKQLSGPRAHGIIGRSYRGRWLRHDAPGQWNNPAPYYRGIARRRDLAFTLKGTPCPLIRKNSLFAVPLPAEEDIFPSLGFVFSASWRLGHRL